MHQYINHKQTTKMVSIKTLNVLIFVIVVIIIVINNSNADGIYNFIIFYYIKIYLSYKYDKYI